MVLAILCSGQGRQHAGMFALTGDAPEATPVFSAAASLLGGSDPRDIVRTETSETLHHNRIGQILCTLQAIAATAALRHAMQGRLIVAGYSVGEIAAWNVAGFLDATDTLNLAARRAEVMDAVTPPGDGMLFVRGISRATIEGLCARHDAAIAIINPGDAFILGGNRKSLDALAAEARTLNATRVVEVPVEVASHTNRLAKASVQFREDLRHAPIGAGSTAGIRLLSGIDASPVLDTQMGLDKLAAQISQSVHWADCLEACIEAGATAFLELGPGRALVEMVTGTYNDVPARSLDDFKTLQGAAQWLQLRGGS